MNETYEKPKLRNELLVSARTKLELTQNQVADKVGVDRQLYSMYERMDLYPRPEVQEKICTFYTQNGIELKPLDVFPEALKTFKPNSNKVSRKQIPQENLETLANAEHLLAEPIDKALTYQDLKIQIRHSLNTLTERESDIVQRYFGLEKYEDPQSLEEISKAYMLTNDRIRQIKEKAIRRLRHAWRSRKLREYLG